jgi:hypothetical protein
MGSAVNANSACVVFKQPHVRTIVHPHTGAVLADPEPRQSLPIEVADNLSALYYQQLDHEEGVTLDELVEVIKQLGHEGDVYACVSQHCPWNFAEGPCKLTLESLLEFYMSFRAPTTLYGERLRRAAARGDLGLVRELLTRGCTPSCDGEGANPLHYAALYGQNCVLKELLRSGCPVNASDRLGWTPLHVSAHGGQECVLCDLIEAGANVNAINKAGRTPLHCAALQDRQIICEVLLKHMARTSIADRCGMTPAHCAAAAGHKHLVQLLREENSHRDLLGYTVDDYIDLR